MSAISSIIRPTCSACDQGFTTSGKQQPWLTAECRHLIHQDCATLCQRRLIGWVAIGLVNIPGQKCPRCNALFTRIISAPQSVRQALAEIDEANAVLKKQASEIEQLKKNLGVTGVGGNLSRSAAASSVSSSGGPSLSSPSMEPIENKQSGNDS